MRRRRREGSFAHFDRHARPFLAWASPCACGLRRPAHALLAHAPLPTELTIACRKMREIAWEMQ